MSYLLNTCKIITDFKKICLDEYPDDIDIITKKDRLALNYTESIHDSEIELHLSNKDQHSLAKNIMELLDTPRLIKHMLRNSWNTWKTLHGEIDLDDIIICNTIKISAPKVYDFLLVNVNSIRSLQSKGLFDDQDKRKKSLSEKLYKIMEESNTDISRIEELVGALFPTWKENYQISRERPQSVRFSSPTDYWKRLNQKGISEKIVPDQTVIHSIKDWIISYDSANNNKYPFLKQLYENEDFSNKFEYFGYHFLDGGHIKEITSQIFRYTLVIEGAHSSRDTSESFTSLWRLSLEDQYSLSQHEEWLYNEMINALDSSLRYTNDIYYFWKHTNLASVQGDSMDVSKEMRKRVIKHFKKLISNNSLKLLDILDENFSFSLFHFIISHSSKKEGGDGFSLEDWDWIIEILISLSMSHPTEIFPHIVGLLVRPDEETGYGNFKLDIELTEMLFKDNTRNIMKFFATTKPQIIKDSSVINMIDTAKIFASKYLDKNSK